MTTFNQAAHETSLDLIENAEKYRVGQTEISGASVIDLGIEHRGGIVAGELLADACLGGAADVFVSAEPASVGTGMSVKVSTDNPLWACLGCQYAGWPLKTDDYFAMTSGPIRLLRGREAMLDDLALSEMIDEHAVAVLESDTLPTNDAIRQLAEEASVAPEQLTVLVAPTTSLAGSIQVVARSVETAMHKLHGLGFDVTKVLSAVGSAPLPPPATKSIEGIGRTNDAILYGGTVTMIFDADQAAIDVVGSKVPSNASRDFGKPFGEVFKSYDYDFYKVDPHLFSPAVITLVSLQSGTSRTFGTLRPDILAASFGSGDA